MTTYTPEERNEIAMTILAQLQPQGKPGVIKAMCGTKTFVVLENGVQFDYKGCRKHNKVRITLNDADLYDVEFWKINTRTGQAEKVSEHNGVYDDMLTNIFESETGLYLSL